MNSRDARRQRRRRAYGPVLMTVLAMTAAVLAACGSPSRPQTATVSPSVTASPTAVKKPGGTLRVVTDTMPTGDPGWATDTASQVLARLVTRTLYAYPADDDVDNEVVPRPDLAVGSPQRGDNGMTLTVQISGSARWDTPIPRRIIATDVARGLKRLCLPPNPSPLRGYFVATIIGYKDYCDTLLATPPDQVKNFIETQSPAGIEVVNNTQIAFHLTKAVNDFVEILALPAAAPVPVEALDYAPNSPDYLSHLISGGPYRISAHDGDTYVLSSNPEWNRLIDSIRAALPDHIRITTGVSAADAQAQIEAGDADMALDAAVPLARARELSDTGDARLSVPTTGSEVMLVVGMRGPNAQAMAEQSVREGLAYCVDRIAVTEALGNPPFVRAATQLLQPSMTGYSPLDPFSTEAGAGDPTKCGDGLAKSPTGSPGQLTLLTTTSARDRAIATALATSFAKAGVRLAIDAKPAAEYAEAAAPPALGAPPTQSWDLALTTITPLWYGLAGRTVFQPLLDPTWVGARPADGGYDASDVRALMQAALESTTPNGQDAIWTEVESAVLNDVAVIPLVVVSEPHMHSASVVSFTELPSLGTGDPASLALGRA